MDLIDRMNSNAFENAVSPYLELGAYEHLWYSAKTSFKSLSEMFRGLENALPSEFVSKSLALESANIVHSQFKNAGINDYNIFLKRAIDYPKQLLDAQYPLELLYFRGDWNLAFTKGIAIVGTRNPSAEGVLRARRLSRELSESGFTIISGLAKGIDSAAHSECIKSGGRTIGVLGTPLDNYYPPENKELQNEIGKKHLLISQVPVRKYQVSPIRTNRIFFPERNKTMSALSNATVIVEAGETSGTLVQARAALAQGRKLFILDNCFKNDSLSWPKKYLEKGAIRVSQTKDILDVLNVDEN